MKTEPLLLANSQWEEEDRIRSLLKLNDATLRPIDCVFAEHVLHWKKLRTDETGDWLGTAPDLVERRVPHFSFRGPLMRLAISLLAKKYPFLKPFECESEREDGEIYFSWTINRPLKKGKQGNPIAYAYARTQAEAICVATTDLHIFMNEFDQWTSVLRRWRISQCKERAK